MATRFWAPVLGWLGAGCAAVVLAAFAPQDHDFKGRLPQLQAKRLDQQQIALPQGLPAERTLAVVVFGRGQRDEARSWIEGMRLQNDRSIAWLKMPVVDDPGEEQARRAIEQRLLSRHGADSDRSRLVLLFTDRAAFVRAAQLSSSDHASVLVVDRRGVVLARSEGPFDESKAQALREVLLAQD
ncbi:MAG TPA: hypothetical protein VLJ58_11370 [Ramlibacter sp.]|nr:hypothetical protein [Ramlibacter sp.]